jgi:hypothetical protein
VPCPIGFAQATTGSSACTLCTGTNFAFEEGADECARCKTLAASSSIQILGLNTEKVGNTIRISAALSSTNAALAGLDPLRNGMQIIIQDASNENIITANLPSGASLGTGSRGWKQKGRGARTTKWTYEDTTAETISGITQATINVTQGSTPRKNNLTISIIGSSGIYETSADALPLRLAIGFGDDGSTACGIRNFRTAQCKYKKSNTVLVCD